MTQGRARGFAAVVLSSALGWLAAGPACAVDGVIEINQAKALAGGVTGTDTPLFPVTIDTSGSYRLTGNLTVDENTTAIEVTSAAKHVDIDLNGFAILGPVTCTEPPTVTCSPSGAGIGIRGFAPDGGGHLRVSHGAVRGMGDSGISTTAAAIVEAVEAMHNRRYGIAGGVESSLSQVLASRNGLDGMFVGIHALVRDSDAILNGGSGIVASGGSVVENNRVGQNVSSGISCSTCTVVGNSSYGNTQYGIVANNGSTTLNNTSRNNTLYGLRVTGVAGYGANVFTGNNGGDASAQVGGSGTAIELSTNVCGTDITCP